MCIRDSICVFISSRLRPVARSLPSVRHRTYHTCDHGTSDRTYLPYMAGKIHPYCLYPCDLDPVLSIYIERWSLYPRKSTDPDDSASLLSDRNLSGKTKKPGDPVFSRGRSLCNNAWTVSYTHLGADNKAMQYLNRLSDYLYVAARYSDYRSVSCPEEAIRQEVIRNVMRETKAAR